MKRAFVFLLSVLLLLCFVSCEKNKNNDVSSDSQSAVESSESDESSKPETTDDTTLFRDAEILSVRLASYPAGYNYTFGGDDAQSVLSYLSNQNYELMPDDYEIDVYELVMGMGWHVTLEYADGVTKTMSVGSDRKHIYKDGKFFKAESEIKFDSIINELTEGSAVTGFSDCFNQIGLYADISQGNFCALLDRFTYQGASVGDLVVGCHEDGEYGGGWIGTGEHFEFVNYYTETDDSYSIYTNSIYTKVQLDNMPLPNDICFGDDIETVLDKCGISLNLARDTSEEVISLYSDGMTTLDLLLYAKLEDGYYGLGYGLQYSLGSVIGDKDETATENIYLSFDKDDKLYSVKISVEKKRRLRSPITNDYNGLNVVSGDRSIIPFNYLLWKKLDNGDGSFTKTEYHKYDDEEFYDEFDDLPDLILDNSVIPRIQANGSIERVYVISYRENQLQTQEITYEELSELEAGEYYVVTEVLLDGNCDCDAVQHSFYYVHLFELIVD